MPAGVDHRCSPVNGSTATPSLLVNGASSTHSPGRKGTACLLNPCPPTGKPDFLIGSSRSCPTRKNPSAHEEVIGPDECAEARPRTPPPQGRPPTFARVEQLGPPPLLPGCRIERERQRRSLCRPHTLRLASANTVPAVSTDGPESRQHRPAAGTTPPPRHATARVDRAQQSRIGATSMIPPLASVAGPERRKRRLHRCPPDMTVGDVETGYRRVRHRPSVLSSPPPLPVVPGRQHVPEAGVASSPPASNCHRKRNAGAGSAAAVVVGAATLRDHPAPCRTRRTRQYGDQ